MKRVITAASDEKTKLYIQYLDGDDYQDNVGVRSAHITRDTLKEALLDLVDYYLNLGEIFSDEDMEEWDELDDEYIFDMINYHNGENQSHDYILYLKNETTGKVYINHNYPEEDW